MRELAKNASRTTDLRREVCLYLSYVYEYLLLYTGSSDSFRKELWPLA